MEDLGLEIISLREKGVCSLLPAGSDWTWLAWENFRKRAVGYGIVSDAWNCFKLQLRATPSGVCNSCGHAFVTNVASGRAGAASSYSCGTPLVGCATLADMFLFTNQIQR